MNKSNVFRSVGAVLAGLVAIVLLSTGTDAVLHAVGPFPPEGQPMSGVLFGLAFVYRSVFSVLGGYLTARIAPRRPQLHANVLGGIGTVASLAGAVATWNAGPEFGPHWYPIALVVTALPTVWLGALLAGARRTPAAVSSAA